MIDNSNITKCFISQSENVIVKIILLFGHLIGKLKWAWVLIEVGTNWFLVKGLECEAEI